MSTINFNGKKFNPTSILKSKNADDLVKRYKLLHPKMSEANVRELYKIAKPEAEKTAKTETQK